MTPKTSRCDFIVQRGDRSTIALIVNGGGRADNVCMAYARGGLWYVEYRDPGDERYHRLGVFQGGPAGEYPDRDRAEGAMWATLSYDLGAITGFCGG